MKPSSNIIIKIPFFGAGLGAAATLAAAGDDTKKSKDELIKLLIRNTILGGVAGLGTSGAIYGAKKVLKDYKNDTLPGDAEAEVQRVTTNDINNLYNKYNEQKIAIASYIDKKADISRDLYYYTISGKANPFPYAMASGGLAALLTYLCDKEGKTNLHRIAGNAGIAALLAGGSIHGYNKYQKYKEEKAQEKDASIKCADDKKFNPANPLLWGGIGASSLGLLSLLTQNKNKKNGTSKALNSAIVGGLLGLTGSLGYNAMNEPRSMQHLKNKDTTEKKNNIRHNDSGGFTKLKDTRQLQNASFRENVLTQENSEDSHPLSMMTIPSPVGDYVAQSIVSGSLMGIEPTVNIGEPITNIDQLQKTFDSAAVLGKLPRGTLDDKNHDAIIDVTNAASTFAGAFHPYFYRPAAIGWGTEFLDSGINYRLAALGNNKTNQALVDLQQRRDARQKPDLAVALAFNDACNQEPGLVHSLTYGGRPHDRATTIKLYDGEPLTNSEWLSTEGLAHGANIVGGYFALPGFSKIKGTTPAVTATVPTSRAGTVTLQLQNAAQQLPWYKRVWNVFGRVAGAGANEGATILKDDSVSANPVRNLLHTNNDNHKQATPAAVLNNSLKAAASLKALNTPYGTALSDEVKTYAAYIGVPSRLDIEYAKLRVNTTKRVYEQVIKTHGENTYPVIRAKALMDESIKECKALEEQREQFKKDHGITNDSTLDPFIWKGKQAQRKLAIWLNPETNPNVWQSLSKTTPIPKDDKYGNVEEYEYADANKYNLKLYEDVIAGRKNIDDIFKEELIRSASPSAIEEAKRMAKLSEIIPYRALEQSYGFHDRTRHKETGANNELIDIANYLGVELSKKTPEGTDQYKNEDELISELRNKGIYIPENYANFEYTEYTKGQLYRMACNMGFDPESALKWVRGLTADNTEAINKNIIQPIYYYHMCQKDPEFKKQYEEYCKKYGLTPINEAHYKTAMQQLGSLFHIDESSPAWSTWYSRYTTK